MVGNTQVTDSYYCWYNTMLTLIAPSIPTLISSLPTKSNVLSIQHLGLVLSVSASPQACLVATTADRYMIT